MLAHEHNRSLPWTFRLPFKSQQSYPGEPTSHPNGLQCLTQAGFGLAQHEASDPFLQQLTGLFELHFVPAPQNMLNLTFDQNRQAQTQHFEQLPLVIHY